jgi:deoxyribodipyrimidine photo-lyase
MHQPEPLTRQDALDRWEPFLPRVKAYSSTRNHVLADHHNVSRLSASLRFRTLLEDEVIGDTLSTHSFQNGEKWLQEICWRRYWKGWLEMRPQVWTQWQQRVKGLREDLPQETLVRAERVMAGESGVACMDVIARELIDTGYLHNHARMWWASFWIHVERLPWEMGADFFFRYLLDADPASNTLSWRWVAGLQTPGKTYLVRLSNLEKYAPGYLRGAAAGSDRIADGAVTAAIVDESMDREKRPLPAYPTSIGASPGRRGLWLHADDLVPEIGPLADLAPAGVFACISDPVYNKTYRLSQQRIDSLYVVLQDGLARAEAHYDCPATLLKSVNPVEGLGSWAKENRLTEVVAFAPMVGPTGDLLPQLQASLEAQGIRLTLIRRATDETAFSVATAGFFPFWQKMSRHLNPLSYP